MFVEALSDIVVRDCLGWLPDGSEARGRNWRKGSLLDVAEPDATSLLRSGAAKPAPEVGAATAAEVERQRQALASCDRRREKADAALAAARAELGAREARFRAAADPALWPAVEEAMADVRRFDSVATAAAEDKAKASAALADADHRFAFAQRRAALAEEAKRREQQAEAAAELVGHVREVKALLDRMTVLNGVGDFAELRQRIQHEVAAACQAMRVRPSDVGWIFR